MKRACNDVTPALASYARGELEALQRTRVAAHLEGCAECAGLTRALSKQLAAAAAWRPELEAAHLERLSSRLRPYMPSAARPRLPRLALGAGAVALASAALVAGWIFASLSGEVPVEQQQATLSRELAPHIQAVHSASWDGRVDGALEDRIITMTRGFVALDVEPGSGRRVQVTTPHARVVVLGTRFFVETDEVRSVVGVAHGEVRVWTGEKETAVRQGETVAFGADVVRMVVASVEARRAIVAVAEYRPVMAEGPRTEDRGPRSEDRVPSTEDREPRTENRGPIAENREAMTDNGKPRPDSRKPKPETREPADEDAPQVPVAELMERAERAATVRDHDAALALYEELAARGSGITQELAALEAAKLRGFVRGELADARRALERLGSSAEAGEVRRQASLARCELERPYDPCAAASCLRGLASRAAEPELASEADALLDRWKLREMVCAR